MITIGSFRTGWIVLWLALALVACRQAGEPGSETALTIPTAASTLATPTLAVTTALETMTPTARPESSATPMFEASPTPSPMPTGSSTPTIVVTAAPSPTNPPPATAEPSPLSTARPAAVISSFTVDVTAVDPGDRITLSWSTGDAVTVTLWHLLSTGQFGTSWDVPTEGSFVYDVNSWERNRTTFMLFASDASAQWVSATLAIEVRCTSEWFIPDPPDVCPYDPPLTSSAAEQNFERGVMIWIAAEDRIVVLFDDGNAPQYDLFQDDWDLGDPDTDPTLTPPPGLFQPVRGFGLVWREAYGNVRDRLGWATDEEMAFETVVQSTSYSKYNSTYLRARDGQLWLLEPERSGWKKLSSG